MVKEVIAVDLGGSYLRVALVRGRRVVKYFKKETPKTEGKLVCELCDFIQDLMNGNVKGIGVSSAGPLKDGVIKNPPNLPLKNFDLQGCLEKKFGKKIVVENDANCAALAEAKFGCKKKDFVVLTIGTGIGGGIIINGELYEGHEGYGGEIGHIILDDGKDFEELWKLNRSLSRKYFGKKLMVKDLLKMKDKRAKKILEEISKYLGQGVASVINVFDPEVVILCGGINETGSVFLNMIKRQMRKYVLLPKVTEVKWSQLEHPGILGASLLV